MGLVEMRSLHWFRSQSKCCHRVIVAVALIGSIGISLGADEPWLSGKAFTEKLRRPLSVSWSEVPLRQALNDLARSHRVAILLDRRIDPDRPIHLDVAGESLADIFQKIADDRRGAISVVNGVVYIGPPDVAKKLRTLIELLQRQAAQMTDSIVRSRWLKPEPLAWGDLATPRQIVEELCRAGEIKLAGIDEIPHDLWAAASFPPLSLAARLSLVLAQFDLTLKIAPDGKSARLVPIPEHCTIERSFPGGAAPQQLAKKWAELLPEAQIRIAGNRVIVDARAEQIDRLTQKPTERHEVASPGEAIERLRIDSLTIERLPLEGVLTSLAQRLGLQLHYDPAALRAAGIKLNQPISVKLSKATVDDALRATLAETGLTFERKGRAVKVFPAAKSAGSSD